MNDNNKEDVSWTWDVFGTGLMMANIYRSAKQPSLRVRLLSKIIMGSKWTKNPSTLTQPS